MRDILISRYKKLFRESTPWIYITIGLALIWMCVGGLIVTMFPGTFPSFLRFLENTFRSILGDIDTLTNAQLARALFLQNSTSATYSLFLGAFLGIIPVLAVATNFFVLGFLGTPLIFFHSLGSQFGTPLQFFLGVAPHGIFELPAFLLAAALGIRLGWQWSLPSSSGHRAKVFWHCLKDAVIIFPLVVLMLGIAAIVEAYVTPYLI